MSSTRPSLCPESLKGRGAAKEVFPRAVGQAQWRHCDVGPASEARRSQNVGRAVRERGDAEEIPDRGVLQYPRRASRTCARATASSPGPSIYKNDARELETVLKKKICGKSKSLRKHVFRLSKAEK